MAERGAFRGGSSRGGGRGGTSRGGGEHGSSNPRGRGGGGGSHGGHAQQPSERPKKENILDLKKYEDKRIIVKFNGGREVQGTLKGYDQLLNLVLDDVEEILRDDQNNQSTRPLGLLVARGTLLTSISPLDGSEEIANPFLEAGDDGEGPVLG